MKPVVLSACLCASLLAACGQAPVAEREPETRAQAEAGATLRGVVPGFGGATVCIDTNRNARCDVGEPSTVSDGNGSFELPGSGALLAQTAGEHGADAPALMPPADPSRDSQAV